MGRYPQREHGLPTTTELGMKIIGAPRVMQQAEDTPPCPCCGCTTLYDITITYTSPLVIGVSEGHYVGCPACPFASPMMSVVQMVKRNQG